jgi:phage terminase small subunit
MNDNQQTPTDVTTLTPQQKTAITKTEKLTLKEQVFIDEYFRNGGNGTQAALVAYDTTDDNTAAYIAWDNLRKPKVKALLEKHRQAIIDRQNITLERAIAPISDALDAKMVIKVKDEDGNVKEIEVVDIDTRLKGSDRALKLLNVTVDKDDNGKPSILNFINVSSQQKDTYGI